MSELSLLDRLESLRATCDCPRTRRHPGCYCPAKDHNATLDDCIREVRESAIADAASQDLEHIIASLDELAGECQRDHLSATAAAILYQVDRLRELDARISPMTRLQRSLSPAACDSSISSKESRPTATDTEDSPSPGDPDDRQHPHP